jgi:hypothetical protein
MRQQHLATYEPVYINAVEKDHAPLPRDSHRAKRSMNEYVDLLTVMRRTSSAE